MYLHNPVCRVRYPDGVPPGVHVGVGEDGVDPLYGVHGDAVPDGQALQGVAGFDLEIYSYMVNRIVEFCLLLAPN